MINRDGHGRDLDARLDRANARVGELSEATDGSGNVVHFRMARHLESLHELAADLNERSKRMPRAGTYERSVFERDLGSLEDQIAVTVAVFASATAEGQEDTAQEMRADIRLLAVEAEAAKSWWRRLVRWGHRGWVMRMGA